MARDLPTCPMLGMQLGGYCQRPTSALINLANLPASDPLLYHILYLRKPSLSSIPGLSVFSRSGVSQREVGHFVSAKNAAFHVESCV